MSIEELQVLITANTNQFTGELKKVGQKLDKLNKDATKTGESIENGLFSKMVGAGAVTSAMTTGMSIVSSGMGKVMTVFEDATKAIIENGSAYSRVKVATDTVTQNLGLTKTKVDDLRKSLQEANVYGVQAENVIKTLAQSGLFKMAESLKTVDARTGNTVTGVNALVLSMKDLSAAAGVDSSEGIDRLTKFVRRGEATFADGIIEIGEINREYGAYAKTVGKTSDTLSAQERAQVRLNVVMRESKSTFGAYANTMISSGKVFDSIGTRLQAMATTIGAALEPIFSVVGNAMFQFLGGLMGSLEDSKDGIRDWATQVAGYIMGLVRVIGRMFSWVPIFGAGFQKLANFTLQPAKSMGTLKNQAGGASGAMNNLAASTAKAKKELLGLAAFDELNVLNSPDDAGGGSGGAGGLDGLGLDGTGGAVDTGLDFTTMNKIADETTARFSELGKSLSNIFNPSYFLAKFPDAIAMIGNGFATAFGNADNMMRKVFGIGLTELIAVNLIGPISLIPNLLDKIGVFDFFKQGKQSTLGELKALSNGAQFEIITMSEKISSYLIGLQANSGKITKTTADNMIKTIDDMRDKIIKSSADRTAKTISDLEMLRDKSKAINDTTYNQLVSKATESGNKQKEATKQLALDVENELRRLQQSGVTITDEMRNGITAKLSKLRDEGIVIMSDNQVQQTAILEKLRQSSNKITAEQAAFAIGQSIANTNAQVENANKTYDESIAAIIRLRDESGTISGEQANEMIKNATRTRDEQVRLAQDGHTKVVDEVTKMAGENINQVDTMTGKTKSGFEMMWSNITKGLTDFGNDFKKKWDEFWGVKIPEGVNKIKSKLDEVWNGVRMGVETGWKAITDKVREGINWVIGKLNGFVAGINNIFRQINDKGAAIGVKVNFSLGSIPYLAKGGVVNGPTVAMLGEAGREAVVPLENNTEWISKIAAELSQKAGSTGATTLVINIGPKQIYQGFVDFVNETGLQTNEAVLNL